MKQFFGKYRGKVANNVDPMQMGRIQVMVPAVLGLGTLSWAMPCVPYAGLGVGFFALPSIGANVWVEFEGGDPDYPIWSGCFWGKGEIPAKPAVEPVKMFKTYGVTMILNDTPGAGGFTLMVTPPSVGTPLMMNFNAMGIELKNGLANVALTPAGISVSQPPSFMNITAGGIEIKNGASSIMLSPAGISVSQLPSTLNINAGAIDFKNGKNSIMLTPASVSVNNGALEVI